MDVTETLRELTHNFKDSSGEIQTAYEDEKDEAVRVLRRFYDVVEVSYDDRVNADVYVIAYGSPRSSSRNIRASADSSAYYIDINELVGLTTDEIAAQLDAAPVGTVLRGIKSKRHPELGDVRIEKRQAYMSNYFNPIRSPHDFKSMKVYWTISGHEDPYIMSELKKIIDGRSNYYTY